MELVLGHVEVGPRVGGLHSTAPVIVLSQHFCLVPPDQQGTQSRGEAKQLVEGEGRKVREGGGEIQGAGGDQRGYIQKDTPHSTFVLATRWDQSAISYVLTPGEGVLVAGEVGLSWVGKEVVVGGAGRGWAGLRWRWVGLRWDSSCSSSEVTGREADGLGSISPGLLPHPHHRGVVVV